MVVIVVLLGILVSCLALINPRKLWWATSSWAYRNPEAAEPSDTRYTISRIAAAVAGLLIIVIALVVNYAAHAERASQAAARAQIKAYSREFNKEYNFEGRALDVGQAVVDAIMKHTPRHASPWSVPLSKVVKWAGLQGSYELLDTANSYAYQGDVTIRSTTGRFVACLRVPGHVVKPDAFDPSLVDVTHGACS